MPDRRGESQLHETAAIDQALAAERRVFLDCVEDILASTPGLQYALLRNPAELRSRDPTAYALFLIQTNPCHDLAVSIELADRAFVVRLNGLRFVRRRGLATRFETWVERRCRDLERMVAGDLEVLQQTLLTVPVSSTLEACCRGRRHRISSAVNNWAAFLSVLVPYGFLMNGRRKRVFSDWFGGG